MATAASGELRFAMHVRLLALARATPIVVIAAGCGGSAPADQRAALPDDYAAQVQAWRDRHEADYRRDFVTIAGLHFLVAGTHTLGSAAGNDIVLDASVPATIGRLTVDGERVRFDAAPGIAVTQEEQPVRPPVLLKEPDRRPAEAIAIGQVSLVVHVTGGRLALRVRDPAGAPARAFAGFAWFPIDPSYRVTGRFIRDAAPQKLPVMNTFNGVDMYDTEGVVEFELLGRSLRLRPFTTRPKRFYFVFRDASSGVETYEAARFLYADLLDDGRVVLDFNEAYNPPCAFNRYTTCPIPLRENVLPVKVLAGERAYAQTEPAEARPHVLYDPDPTHVWNRVHEMFRARAGPDGSLHGFDTVDPLLWRETRHLLSGPSHTAALGILDEFLSSNGESLIVDPLERAVFQHDLWAVFDWLAATSDGEKDARSRLMTRVVRVMRRVALARAQIEALPDTYAEALASGRLRLPDDLFAEGGPWVGVGGTGPVAPHHAAELGRSAFAVLWNLPGGRRDTLGFLRTLWEFPQPFVSDDSFQMARDGERRVKLNPTLPNPPDGTRLALVRRMLVIDDQGVILPTNIVQTVQLRVLGKEQAFSEFTMSRARLFTRESGGLRAVSADETGFLTFSAKGMDPFERPEPARAPRGARLLDGCVNCHQTGVDPVPVLESIRSARSVLRPSALVDPAHPRWSRWFTQANVAGEAKSRTYEWGLLQGLWGTQPW